MRRLRTRRVDLGLLLLFGILISGSQTADVDAKADDMAKRIEEQSKKVEDQSTKMVSEIEAKGKNVEDANQEKTFEEASKRVDDIMNQSEKEVDDKANFAEELQNQADKKVEEIGKNIEETSNPGHGISRRRRASALVIRRPELKRDLVQNPKTAEVSGKAKDKIEPSKVVVLPDVAIRGTDSDNMQIKELKSQKSHGIWLAVHIPDKATALRPVKIMSTKKAAEDLEKIIGPNRETMFKELQTIIGVDGVTLRKMLKAGQIDGKSNRKIHKIDDDEDENEEERDEESEVEGDEEDKEEEKNEDEEEHDSGDDTKCQDDENEDEEEDQKEEEEEDVEDGEEIGRKHKNKQKEKLKNKSKQMDKTSNKTGKKPKRGKKCSGNKMLPWVSVQDDGSGADSNSSSVLQPEGHEAPLANVLNKIHVRLNRKKACNHPKNPIIKELCKQVNRPHRNPRPNWNQPRRHLHLSHKKYYRYLKRLMRKFLNRHSGRQAQQVLQYMNLLLSDQLRLSSDGIVHLYPNSDNGKGNNYGDGFKALVDDNSATKGRNSPPLEPPIIDDNMYNGNIIRVPVPGSTRGTTAPHEVGIMSNSQANVLNNQAHTKLGDPHSSEGDTQMQMLKEELGRANEELREQQKEKQRDDAIMDKYMFNFQSLAEKGPINAFDGMQRDAEQRVNGQQVSVIDPNQISLKESRLPIRNRLDVPSLGGYVGGQFTGFSRRNRIQNYLANVAKRVQSRQTKKLSEKSDEAPSNVERS